MNESILQRNRYYRLRKDNFIRPESHHVDLDSIRAGPVVVTQKREHSALAELNAKIFGKDFFIRMPPNENTKTIQQIVEESHAARLDKNLYASNFRSNRVPVGHQDKNSLLLNTDQMITQLKKIKNKQLVKGTEYLRSSRNITLLGKQKVRPVRTQQSVQSDSDEEEQFDLDTSIRKFTQLRNMIHQKYKEEQPQQQEDKENIRPFHKKIPSLPRANKNLLIVDKYKEEHKQQQVRIKERIKEKQQELLKDFLQRHKNISPQTKVELQGKFDGLLGKRVGGRVLNGKKYSLREGSLEDKIRMYREMHLYR